MIQILIKSFNRAYYLDRCLQSIQKFVKGDYEIIVLDDGTPEKYLNKIRKKYPEVEIQLSSQYSRKIKAIQENLETGKEINGFQIPTDLWYNAVKNASDYVLVTEDDVWFTEEINLSELANEMQENTIHLVKVGRMKSNVSADVQSITSTIYLSTPKNLWTAPPFLMDWFMFNKFKFFSILYRLKLVDNQTKREYWQLNSILMGFWRKDYWLYVWKDIGEKVDEEMQLKNAVLWYRKNKRNQNLIGTTKTNHLKTTFQSSATNSYHQYGFNFDVNYFNHLMNEAWLKDELDSFQNFPKDFSLSYFEQFLDEKVDKKAFHSWVEKFKEQYRKTGAEVD